MQLSLTTSIRRLNGFPVRLDIPLFLLTLLLCLLGLAVQFSAGGEDLDQLIRQAVRIAIAVAFMLALSTVPIEVLRRFSPPIYLAAVGLVILVLAIGFTGRGAQRWLDLGVFRFQPSELLKLAIPMMIAYVLTTAFFKNYRHIAFLISGVLVLVPAFLVYLQPDLGTALLIIAVGASAIFFGGLSWRWVGISSFSLLALIPIVWPFLQDYQKTRVLTLFDPWSDPLGQGYHSIQSMIAIGSGGISGKGWLQGSQSQLDFLPERNTDFVFSVFAEEFGFVGGLILILIYSLLIARCLMIAYRCDYDFARIVVCSVAIMTFVHLFVNVGMVAGILPVVGLPLPLISYGGTSMVTVLAGLGLVMGAQYAKRTV